MKIAAGAIHAHILPCIEPFEVVGVQFIYDPPDFILRIPDCGFKGTVPYFRVTKEVEPIAWQTSHCDHFGTAAPLVDLGGIHVGTVSEIIKFSRQVIEQEDVRELENVIERAAILADDHVIHGFNLPPSLQSATTSGTSCKIGLQGRVDAVCFEMIVDALRTNRGNISSTARELGLTRHSLRLKMDKLHIDYQKFRP